MTRTATFRSTVLILSLLAGAPMAGFCDDHYQHMHAHQRHGSDPVAPAPMDDACTTTLKLPPLPPGVEQLVFKDFFVSPVGPRGLEFSAKMRGLDGKKVRLLGYMARQEEPGPGVFILAPSPIQLHEHEYGLADDLPPQALHVVVPTHPDRPALFTPGPLLLTGTLKLGNRQEADGRVSFARLVLDAPTSGSLPVRVIPADSRSNETKSISAKD